MLQRDNIVVCHCFLIIYVGLPHAPTRVAVNFVRVCHEATKITKVHENLSRLPLRVFRAFLMKNWVVARERTPERPRSRYRSSRKPPKRKLAPCCSRWRARRSVTSADSWQSLQEVAN